MYKCPECNRELYCKYYRYSCINLRCDAFKYGKGFTQAYCDKFLIGGREVKEVRVIPLFDGEMYEIWFPLAGNPRGYFKSSIQPIIDIIKAKVPITAREYNPDSKHWTLAKEYYVAIIEVMKAMGFKVTVQETAKQNAPNVDVPKDYEENFYRSEAKPSAGAEDVRASLFKLMGIIEEPQSYAILKGMYRFYARLWHPDLGGDAAKMSELNRLWSLYNAS